LAEMEGGDGQTGEKGHKATEQFGVGVEWAGGWIGFVRAWIAVCTVLVAATGHDGPIPGSAVEV